MSKIDEAQLLAFREELQKLGSKWYVNAANGARRFAQRQVHALSGWTPEGFSLAGGAHTAGIERIGAGAAQAREALSKAVSPKERALAAQALAANERAQSMGLTSIPGYIDALRQHGVKNVAKASLAQQLHGTTGFEKALTVGLPALGLGAELASRDDGHKGERLGETIAGTAAGMLTGGMPLAGGMLAGIGAGAAGQRLGRAIDRLRAPRPTVQPPPNPEEARGQHVPTEREMSPAAAGQAPEVLS